MSEIEPEQLGRTSKACKSTSPKRSSGVLVADDYRSWRDFICSLLHTKAEFRIIAELADGLDGLGVIFPRKC